MFEICDVLMSKGSILLVDDDKDILELFQMALLEDGYGVETAVSGMEALSKVKENKYDVAVLDVVLPDVQGDKLALEIKRHRDSVNIIFITGYANMVDCINSLPIGVSDILLKPITVAELQQAVKDAINIKPSINSTQS
jgi:DNA-binding response OmpR family regulator